MTFWHSTQLAVALALFGVSTYTGLEQYLDHSLRRSLVEQARAIGEKFLVGVGRRGDDNAIHEINENYSPEINGRFIRIIRQDGSIFYQSLVPRDASFDPKIIPNSPFSEGDDFRSESIRNSNKLVIYSLHFVVPGGPTYLVETGGPDGAIRSTLHGLLLTLAVGLPVLVGLSVATSYFLMRKALQPMNEITEQAERITSRNLSERLATPATGDEIERLSASLNRMIGRLEDSFHHINRFTADVSHELRTPLTILRGELESIAQHRVQPEQLEMIGSALEETDRLTRIVDHLLEISRLDAGEGIMERKLLDLGELVKSTAEQMHLLADEKGIAIHYKTRDGIEVDGNEARLRQVVANLLDNAIKYTPEGGWVELYVDSDGPLAILAIADNGTGIPADAIPHVFDRFYRADRARSRDSGGTGLGLAIVKAICMAHGAEIAISSIDGEGTRFRIEFRLGQIRESRKSGAANLPKLRADPARLTAAQDSEY